jgi:nitrate/nitrite transport system ATP-binding protein
MAFLELKNLTKSYGSEKGAIPILENINLEIERGEFVAIVGYSGAGKTTLISLIAGLIQPDAGTITLNDLEITAPGPDRGIVFQNYSLLPWLSAFENVLLAVTQAFPNWSSGKKEQHTQKYLELVNLGPARDKKPGELSGGMRQRVSLARALAMDPQILLLDEPLSALDALTRATLQDEISRIREETHKTVVLITNDPDEGIYLADRIIPLTAGPRATLGRSFAIEISRPRDRKLINHDLHFKQLRRDVAEFLLNSRRAQHTSVTKKLVLPDIEPEDLSLPRTLGRRRTSIRRNEIKRETIEVE